MARTGRPKAESRPSDEDPTATCACAECPSASPGPAELGSVIATAGQALLPAVADDRVRPLIDTTLAFDTAARAAERLRSHQAQGKIVLTVP